MKGFTKQGIFDNPTNNVISRLLIVAILMVPMVLYTVAGGASITRDGSIEKEEFKIAIDTASFRPSVETYSGVHGRLGSASVDREVQWLSEPGEPDIAWKVITVLVGPDTILSSVVGHIDQALFEPVAGTWQIPPAPPAATWHGDEQIIVWPEDKRIIQGRDADIYERDAFWPEASIRILGTGKLRQWKLVQVAIPMVHYNPVRKQLMVLADEAQVKIRFYRSVSVESNIQPDSIGRSTVERIATNFKQVYSEYETEDLNINSETGPISKYVIITTSAIESASIKLADFVAHKQSIGFDVQVITEEDFGGGLGDTAAENIRAWLQEHYLSDNIEYVLLIGNPHPTSGDVPMKMLWPRNNSGKSNVDSPSDYYYADLTGNWDLDGDGFYGEWPKRNGREGDFGDGGVDRFWEVLIGRIPHYGNISDTDAILERIIAYEKQDETSAQWRTSCLLPMEPSDSSTPGYHLGEQIKNDILVPHEWSYHRVYEEEYGLVPPPESTPCNYDTVTNAWAGNPAGLVVWWTHGNISIAADVMDLSHLPSLDDNYPSFTFQVSCLNSYPEANNNLAYELLCHGGINTISATRVSWYYVGQTQFDGSASNSGMGYEYTARFVGAELSCSLALQDLKQVLTPTVAEMWMNFTVFNIYGDPSCHVKPVAYANPLIPGDFDNDSDVDLVDFGRFSAAWLTTLQEPEWDSACDLTEPADGVVDNLDLTIFNESWLQGKML